MVAIAVILVIFFLSAGIVILNMRRSSIEKRSVIGYKRGLGVLSEVVKRSESFVDVHQPTEEELAQPHIHIDPNTHMDEEPERKNTKLTAKSDAVNYAEPIPRVRILPTSIGPDGKIVFDDFSSGAVPMLGNSLKAKIDIPEVDQSLQDLVGKLRPQTQPVDDGQDAGKITPKAKTTAKAAGIAPTPDKLSGSVPGKSQRQAGKPKAQKAQESHNIQEPLTEVISAKELAEILKPTQVTKRRLDTSVVTSPESASGAMTKADLSDGEEDDTGFGFITGNEKLRKIATVAASVVAAAALAGGISQLASGNSPAKQHLAATGVSNSAKTNPKVPVGKSQVKAKTGGSPTGGNVSNSGGIAPVSATPSVVSYTAPKGTYTITFKASPQGQCWVGIQSKANGPYLWMATIAPGSSATYQATGSIVVRVGAPPYATVEVNGLDVSFPKSNIQPFDMVFTPTVANGASS